MDKSLLIESSRALEKVSLEAAEEYSRKSDRLAEAVSNALLQREDLTVLIGPNNLAMMKDNHANHARFIASILQHPNPEVLVESVLWVFRAYRNHGFSTSYWAAQLNAWFRILPEELSETAWTEIRPYYHWLQVNIPLFAALTDQPRKGN